jgi:tRNA A-37 threonylcarbamoyl transferase component Bud32
VLACPKCQTQVPDDAVVCPRDGTPLDEARRRSDAELVLAATMPELPAPSSSGATAGADGASAAMATAPAPAVFDPLVGATLAARYQIVRRIGEGGMGAVYEAKHAVIGKRVAVKVLLEKFLTKSDFVARLLQEARLASSIGHENIVDVTDFGTTDDGRSFVVMEFLDGEALSQLIMREAPLPIERSLRIARQVASALGAAHAKGIYHRDVKPENVYLVQRSDTDFVKVVDFGISKAVKQGAQGDEGPESYRLTHTGLLLGTPLYMSPEQARGDEDLDHRVDIWALGVMMYECLTGEVPFRANNYLGIISQVLTHAVEPPSKVRPELGIPEAVEAVVMRAMEKDRTRRYAAMADLERDLERLLAGDQNVGLPLVEAGDAPAKRLSAPPGRWHLGLAAGVALVVGIALALSRPAGVRAPTSAAAVSGASAARSTGVSPPLPFPVPAVDGAPLAAPGTAGAAPAHVAKGPATRPRPRAERHGDPAAATAKAVGAATDSVKRGVLPSGSREAYPDQ